MAGTAARRRTWMRAALGLLGWAAVPARAIAIVQPAGAQRANTLDPREFDVLGGRAALAQTGAVYLAAFPLERDPDLLLRLLAPDATLPLRAALLAAIARDWTRHDVIVIDGWVMARSEARICALACLAAPA